MSDCTPQALISLGLMAIARKLQASSLVKLEASISTTLFILTIQSTRHVLRIRYLKRMTAHFLAEDRVEGLCPYSY